MRRSWFADLDAEDIRGEIDEFSAIWDRQDPQLLILPLPEAVRRYLDHFQHYFELGEQGPPRDPLDGSLRGRTDLMQYPGLTTRSWSPLSRKQTPLPKDLF